MYADWLAERDDDDPRGRLLARQAEALAMRRPPAPHQLARQARYDRYRHLRRQIAHAAARAPLDWLIALGDAPPRPERLSLGYWGFRRGCTVWQLEAGALVRYRAGFYPTMRGRIPCFEPDAAEARAPLDAEGWARLLHLLEATWAWRQRWPSRLITRGRDGSFYSLRARQGVRRVWETKFLGGSRYRVFAALRDAFERMLAGELDAQAVDDIVARLHAPEPIVVIPAEAIRAQR